MHNLLKKKDIALDSPQKAPHVDLTHAFKTVKNEEKGAAGFAKINVAQIPIKPHRKGHGKKILLGLLIVLLAVGLLTIVFGVLPVQATYRAGQALANSGKELATALKNQNLEEAKTKLPETKSKLDDVQKSWDKAYLIKLLPFLNKYHADVVHGLNAASEGLDALKITIETLEPYSDLLGLKGKSTFTGGSADERIQLAVQTLDKVTPQIEVLGDKISVIKKEIDQIDPNRYPEYVAGKSVRAKLVEAKELVNSTTGLFLDAKPLLEVLPQLLGEPTAKRYMVLFQNDKELRPTGGFITAYANFRVEHGKFIVEKSADIYELDDQIKSKKPAPEKILTYHKGVYYFNIRDSNLSPDFSESMKQFIELYPNKWDFDGIIAVDTHVLVEAMKILGDFTVAGRKFSAENDPRCDCPGVIYELEDYATRPVAYVRTERKDVLGDLLLQIMKKALGVSPSQYWGQLFQMGISEINQKHILAYMIDEKAQKGIESLNMGGRIADGTAILDYADDKSWDYLHVNNANMAGAKSNLFLQQEVKQEYTVESDGSIIKALTIDYKNPAPASNCNLEAGQLCLNGILRNWIRVYVPEGSELIESEGSVSPKDDKTPEDFKISTDLGKTVFEGFLTVRPLGSSQVVLKYRLPFKKTAAKLSAMYQKQPGTDGYTYSVFVNGKQKDKFTFNADRFQEISL